MISAGLPALAGAVGVADHLGGGVAQGGADLVHLQLHHGAVLSVAGGVGALHQAALRDDDPMRTKYFSYGFYYSLFKNLLQLTYDIKRNMPLLIISGSRDIVSMNSRLATALYRTYHANDMNNLTIIIYPNARHELLMDTNYADVQRDVLDFFNSIIVTINR